MCRLLVGKEMILVVRKCLGYTIIDKRKGMVLNFFHYDRTTEVENVQKIGIVRLLPHFFSFNLKALYCKFLVTIPYLFPTLKEHK